MGGKRGGGIIIPEQETSLCLCVCVCAHVCVCECVCLQQRGCEGGEAYVASVTRSVNKSQAEGLNRALFCLIQILPESTFILLIK